MKRRIILVALGGNALFPEAGKGTIEEQEAIAKRTCEQLLPLIATGDPIVITHGNGPQVGRVLLSNELLRDQIPPAPLDVCVSSTEGTMGYILQQALLNELRRNSVERYVVTTPPSRIRRSRSDHSSRRTRRMPFESRGAGR